MKPVRILMFSGSARRDSINQRLVEVAAKKAKELGAEVDVINLADFDMPLFNQDLEADSFPESARALREKMIAADGLLLACPEYNGSITPLLKNTIDWTSRPQENVAEGLVAYHGQVAALIAASPGGLGGMRGLVHVRAILSGIGVTVIPEDLALGSAYQAFDENGGLADDRMDQRLDKVVKGLMRTAKALRQEVS
ncbi:MAG: NADPH-dependent FMN reductase [Planctomycetota bacterium]|nr:MAG: NADPH-dependent FMN reductase [Planctomycetota bacterium]